MKNLLHNLVLSILAMAVAGRTYAADKPSVLFVGGVHAKYVAQPLHAMGVEIDVCKPEDLADRLRTTKYNVVVTAQQSEADLKTLEQFCRDGGGVFVTNPGNDHHGTESWTASNKWLTGLGAKPRWEGINDRAPDNVVSSQFMRHSFSTHVEPPVNEGVEGVLTMLTERVGYRGPMTYDFSDDWKVVVRGADSMHTTIPTHHSEMAYLKPWLVDKPIEHAPPLLAIRPLGRGRIAVTAHRKQWVFTPPANCPPSPVMLTDGANGKPSDWLKVFANTFKWLAEPSLQKGWGGAETPEDVLTPPVKTVSDLPKIDWANRDPMVDQPQISGLVGARTALSGGSGTVADYAKAAKAAGLDFIVFLENSLQMTPAQWEQLIKECEAESTDTFGAIPGLTIEDAQGNHLFVLGDGAKFPQKDWLFDDGRLKTTTVSRTEVMFKYIIQYMQYDTIVGFWNHEKNYLHQADYKLQNAWCLFSRSADGQMVDSSLDDYLYWQGCAGEQALFAFEFMTSPDQVAERAKNGWVIKGHPPVPRPPWKFPHIKSDEPRTGLAGLRKRWEQGNHWHPQYQYVTQGPEIRAWEIDNNVVTPWGEWWRPDVWQYRIRLSAASDAGLKEITIFDGDRGVFRRFEPNGAKTFEHTMVLSNTQQRDLVPIIEDVDGKRAVGMSLFNRNTMLDQFICGDRCNFLGRSMLRTRDNRPVYTPPGFRPNLGISPSKGDMDLLVQPDISTTLDTPTLPIDGRPIGAPKFSLQFKPSVPSELERPFSLPTVYMVGPDMGIGQGTYKLGYDPDEMGAQKTPLGHPYEEPQKQGQIGRNAWTSWYRLVPLKKINGWARIHVAGWLPEEVRYGWFELYWEMIDDAELKPEGIQLGYFGGECEVYRNGKLVASPDKGKSTGTFSRGTIAVVPTGLIIAMDDQLQYEYTPNTIRFFYKPEKEGALAKGDEVHLKIGFGGVAAGTPKDKILAFARQFGITEPGTSAYAPKMAAGKQVDDYFTWNLNGQQSGIRAEIPQTRMHGNLTAVVENLNDNWSVQLVDYNRGWPNHRALPHRDGRAYAQLDLNLADSDVFIGHPVVADESNIKLLVSWMEPGTWFIEAHNAGEKVVSTTLKSPAAWEVFKFDETVELAPGSSRTWEVKTADAD